MGLKEERKGTKKNESGAKSLTNGNEESQTAGSTDISEERQPAAQTFLRKRKLIAHSF